MQKITTFLMFNDQAEPAVKLYTSVFKNSRIIDEMPGPDGNAMGYTFEIDGQRFNAMNGGPHFTFAEGMSLFVSCETQEEIDALWEKLSEGGEKQPCGWLKDRFGVSWQIIPSVLGELLSDPDRERAGRAMEAMLKMGKLDIAGLRRAYDGGP
jgi:predicted 3-demethylubiquinone-9 3-methyltransferase (glyoxalase superfamily)